MDHDQRFKTLLREFFPEFVQLFLPDFADALDATRAEWLEQEVFPDPPQGERRVVDLLAKVPAREPLETPSGEAGSLLALIHVEVEHKDSVTELRRWMFEYYTHLTARHDLPVLPVGLYLRVGLGGLGWDSYERSFRGRRLVLFEYPYIGLPALNAEDYLRGDNWLGVALTALMDIPAGRRLEFGSEAYRRLVKSGESVYRKYLLCECVGVYLPADEGEESLFRRELLTSPDQEVQAMSVSVWEKSRQEGLQQGLERGLERGHREALLLQTEARFGPPSDELRRKVESATPEQVKQWLLDIARGRTLEEMGLA